MRVVGRGSGWIRLGTAGAVLAVLAACSLTDEPPGGRAPTTPADDTAAVTEDAPADTDTDAGSGTGSATDATGTAAATAPGSDTGTDTDTTATSTSATGIDPAGVDLAELTVGWPCGYAFELSHPDGSATLVLQWVVPEAELPSTVALPHPRWQAQLHVGENLAGVSCTPGTEPAGAQETWPVQAGVIRFTEQGGTVPQGPVRAGLSGVIVSAPDGTRLELPNQEVTNSGWGVTYDE